MDIFKTFGKDRKSCKILETFGKFQNFPDFNHLGSTWIYSVSRGRRVTKVPLELGFLRRQAKKPEISQLYINFSLMPFLQISSGNPCPWFERFQQRPGIGDPCWRRRPLWLGLRSPFPHQCDGSCSQHHRGQHPGSGRHRLFKQRSSNLGSI